MKLNKNIIVLIQMVCILIVGGLYINSCNRIKEMQHESKQLINMKSAIEDTLHKSVNKLGQELSYKKLLIGTISQLKNSSSNKDSTIDILKKMVDSKTISATVLISKTSISGGNKSIIDTTREQSINKDGKIYVYPTYTDTINSKWAKGWITANKDSIKYKMTLLNEFDIKTEYKRDNFWKSKYPIISVLNKNPNTETINVNNFTLDKEKKKQSRLLVFLEGAIIGTATYMIFIKK